MKKACKFDESLLSQIGFTEIDYLRTLGQMIELKIGNNIRLTPEETSFWVNNGDEYLKLKWSEQ